MFHMVLGHSMVHLSRSMWVRVGACMVVCGTICACCGGVLLVSHGISECIFDPELVLMIIEYVNVLRVKYYKYILMLSACLTMCPLPWSVHTYASLPLLVPNMYKNVVCVQML